MKRSRHTSNANDIFRYYKQEVHETLLKQFAISNIPMKKSQDNIHNKHYTINMISYCANKPQGMGEQHQPACSYIHPKKATGNAKATLEKEGCDQILFSKNCMQTWQTDAVTHKSQRDSLEHPMKWREGDTKKDISKAYNIARTASSYCR